MNNLRSLGLTRHEGELLAYLVLDWLYDYNTANPGLGPRLQELAEFANRDGDVPALRTHAGTIHKILAEQHLIRVSGGMGGPWVYGLALLPIGRLEAERIRQQRSDKGARKIACRHAILLWLGEQDVVAPDEHISLSGIFSHPLGYYYGAPFTNVDIERAASWLVENLLIECESDFDGVDARLTSRGSDCVEIYKGDISAYLGSRTMTSGPTINVHGNNSGNIGQATHGNVTQYQQGIDVEAVLKAIGAVRETLPALQLGDEDNAELTRTMDELDEKGKAGTLTEDQKNSLLQRVRDILKKSAASVAGFLLDAINNLMS
ncbi:hypothetical protein AAH991_38540 [Microbispora sp. ZYX-F-249]|uniref:AbiTii domain-containing protein n=1 Tax=Microbispora maris TaxID=3144104 RepID=A0ABV0B3V1_9ACTN